MLVPQAPARIMGDALRLPSGSRPHLRSQGERMRTNRRFRVAGSAPSRSRRFRLPQGERASAPFAPLETDSGRERPGLQFASERAKYEYRERDKPQTPARTPARRGKAAAHTQRAPRMDTSPLANVSLRVASELPMPGFFGDVILRCGPENHDHRRLTLGVMSLLQQHEDDVPVGRCTSLSHVRETGGWALLGEAEIADIPAGRRVLEEMRSGARAGVSPGFLLLDYDIDDDFNMDVTKTEVIEVSVVTAPRNYGARVLSLEASMNGALNRQVVSIDDPVGLSLSAGRQAMRDGKGTSKQRRKLGEFFKTYDNLRGSGQSRDSAAAAARSAAGLA